MATLRMGRTSTASEPPPCQKRWCGALHTQCLGGCLRAEERSRYEGLRYVCFKKHIVPSAQGPAVFFTPSSAATSMKRYSPVVTRRPERPNLRSPRSLRTGRGQHVIIGMPWLGNVGSLTGEVIACVACLGRGRSARTFFHKMAGTHQVPENIVHCVRICGTKSFGCSTLQARLWG